MISMRWRIHDSVVIDWYSVDDCSRLVSVFYLPSKRKLDWLPSFIYQARERLEQLPSLILYKVAEKPV